MTYEPVQQVLFIFFWLITIKILQFPVSLIFKPVYDTYSPAVAYPISLLFYSILTTIVVFLSLPFWVAVIPYVLIIGFHMFRGNITRKSFFDNSRYDIIFILFFFFALEFRYLNPVISHFSEQFMDHAFLVSIMRMPMIPPLDPWFSGGDLSMYYYAGHWTFAMISLLAHVPSVISFNLILPTIFGLSAVSLLMIGKLFSGRYAWLPLATLVIIPPSILWYLLNGIEFWIALNNTRWIITGCITEYPLFSLFLGDSHVHVMGLFNQVFLISLIFYTIVHWNKQTPVQRVLGSAITAVSFGYMIVCNSWDFLAYSPLFGMTGILLALRGHTKPLWSRLFFLFGTSALAFIFWSPILLSINTGSFRGISLLSTPIEPFQMLLYAGIFIGVILIYGRSEIQVCPSLLVIPLFLLAIGNQSAAIISLPLVCLLHRLFSSKEDDQHICIDLIGITGFSILFFCTLFQVTLDSDATAMNTVFKFGYAAWVLLAVTVLLIIGDHLDRLDIHVNFVVKPIISVIFVICLLSAPFLLHVNLARDLVGLTYPDGYRTLDGSAYLVSSYGDDYNAFRYAESLPDESVILEGLGGDYSYSTPVSTFSGIPTVLGKFSHEFQWRGSRYGWMPDRRDEVKMMYENPLLAPLLLQKYRVTHVYVGKSENLLYNVSLPLEELVPVWSGNYSKIYRVSGREEHLSI